KSGCSLGEQDLAGRAWRASYRSFLAPANNFRIAGFGYSLGEKELAGRAQG
ncbi:hypothetical protein A2U01_0034994, partial [Trifolium medium]|nr:hypothetical protein [Trifolium medium]